MGDPILDDLNAAQAAAVMHGEGPLMVLAGAGSGKTRVVTRRIARLLRGGVPPRAILAVTFTNKAAGEMARRVEQLGGAFVRVATFHSACARFLRADGHLLGYPPDYSIYDVQDRDSLLKELMGDLGISSPHVKPALVGQLISKFKNTALRPAEGDWAGGEALRIVERLWTPYHERMRRLAAMDFDDLLVNFLALLREHPAAAERYRERFPWLLVDEFQDTNRVQYDLLKQLCPAPGNLCVVGDPDQSIYSFRGAEIRNILDFEGDYPTATVVRLEQNYRSTANILRAAEAVIEHNTMRKAKRLYTAASSGPPLLRLRAAGATAEAEAIADRITSLITEGEAADQIAVLYRAHWLSRGLEQALKQHGIPYEIVGGLTFFERREIKDLLAYLRVLVNPLDDVSMGRIVNVPPRGIGRTTMQRLQQIGSEHGMSLFEVVLAPDLHAGLGSRAQKGLAGLAAVLDRARAAATHGAHAALHAVLGGTDYVEHATGFGDAEDSTRAENIAELVSDTVQFDQQNRDDSGDDLLGPGLAGYLQHVALLTSADAPGEGPAVRLMTVHAAKGLEFDHVFLAGLEEGVLPSARAAEEPEGLEEERRLMYVALTRARRSVLLSSARERLLNGSREPMQPSRFLRELPADCVENYNPSWQRYELDDAGSLSTGWTVAADPEALAGLRPGARVQHERYGRGAVRRIAGRGVGARAVVSFDDGVEREFVLEYAGLQLVEDFDG